VMGVSVSVLNAEDERPDAYDPSETIRAVPLIMSSTNSFSASGVIVIFGSIHPKFFQFVNMGSSILVVVPAECMYIVFISYLMEHGMMLFGFCIGWLLRNGRVRLLVRSVVSMGLHSVNWSPSFWYMAVFVWLVDQELYAIASSFHSLASSPCSRRLEGMAVKIFPNVLFQILISNCEGAGILGHLYASLLAFGIVLVALHSNTLRSISFKSAQRISLNVCTLLNIAASWSDRWSDTVAINGLSFVVHSCGPFIFGFIVICVSHSDCSVIPIYVFSVIQGVSLTWICIGSPIVPASSAKYSSEILTSCPVMVFVWSCCSNICTWSMVWLPNVSSDPNPPCMYGAIASLGGAVLTTPNFIQTTFCVRLLYGVAFSCCHSCCC